MPSRINGFDSKELDAFRKAAQQLALNNNATDLETPEFKTFNFKDLRKRADEEGLQRDSFIEQRDKDGNVIGRTPSFSNEFLDEQFLVSKESGNKIIEGFKQRQKLISQRRAAPGNDQTRLV